MNILNDNNLSHYTTMQIGGLASQVIEVSSEADITDVVALAKTNNQKLQVIGLGSNIIFTDEGFDGIVVVNKIPGLLIDPYTGVVRVGAGTVWNDVVRQSMDAGLIGIEAMVSIPGSCGATPINNVGAYGQEIKDVLVSLRAYDTQTDNFVELSNAECNFSYRNSRFKSEDYGRFIITSLTLQLKLITDEYTAPQYPALTAYLNNSEIYYPSPQDVMRSIVAIRSTKLPDPSKLANTGSFFKNPIINTEKLNQLLAEFPNIPHYPQADGLEKIPAGWLIDTAGLKGYRQNGMWVYDKHALVLVNEGAQCFADLDAMVRHIQSVVEIAFGVKLEPEPEIITK